MPLELPPILLASYLAVLVLWRAPLWGSRVLDFFRDLREFRQGN